MNFKTQKEYADWVQMCAGDYAIVPVVTYADNYARMFFTKHLTVTHIFRSDEEQRELYESRGKEYRPSVHSHWRGVDIRVSTLTHSEREDLVGAVNARFSYGRGKVCAIDHDIGAGAHIHLQVPTKKGPWNG